MTTTPTTKNKKRPLVFRLPPWLIPGLLMAAIVPAILAQADPAAPPAAADPAAPAAAPAGGEAVEPVVTKTPERSLLQWFQAGGWFMYPIALCSFLGTALILERFMSLRKGATVPAGFVSGLKAAMGPHRDPRAGLEYCRANDSPLARIIAAGLKKSPRGSEAVEKAMEDAGAGETVKLRRNMRFLYSIASVSTLLGLVGTIHGMINAFQAAEAVGTGKFGPLAAGIYTALITTFSGLVVAIPVTVFYFYFSGKIERLVTALNDETGEFVDHFDDATGLVTGAGAADAPLQYAAPAGAPPAAAPAAPGLPGGFAPAGGVA